MRHSPLLNIRRMAALLFVLAMVPSVQCFGAGDGGGLQPPRPVGPPLAALAGPAARDLDCLRGADGRFTVFYTADGTAADAGRIAWVSRLSGPDAGDPVAGLVPLGRTGDTLAYGPVALLLPGETQPSAVWVERQDGGCRVFHSRAAGGGRRWTVPETVFPNPVDLVRFIDGAGSWLVWVEGRTHNDEIVACHRGPGGWERPVAVSLDDQTEDLSPRVAIDPAGAPWVVWAGARAGGRDEILFSRLREGEWVPERLVSREDDTPDVLPDLVISPSGLACAAWLGYARESRDYQVTVSCSSDGETWSEELRVGQGSFARPPRLVLLENGRFLLVWSDAAGNFRHLEHDGEKWTAPRTVHPLGGDSAALGKASLLLLYRSHRTDGSLVAVPRLLP